MVSGYVEHPIKGETDKMIIYAKAIDQECYKHGMQCHILVDHGLGQKGYMCRECLIDGIRSLKHG